MSAPRVRFTWALMGAVLFAGGCATTTTQRLGLAPVQTVARVELSRYLGQWYEIASFPQSFQAGCTATTATYTLREDGEIDVLNRCRKGSIDGKESSALGRARVVDGTTNARLEVSFFGPFWGDYWIIDLAPDYTYAVVGHPGRDYLWILSRTPMMSEDNYRGILQRLEGQGYETFRLVRTPQVAGAPADVREAGARAAARSRPCLGLATQGVSMRVHGNRGSTCTRKVLMTFAEKGVTPDFTDVELAKGEHKQPAHVAFQPFGQVPVLVDGDFVLYESRAIIRYLDEVLPGTALTPKDPKARARMEQWMSVETSNFTPHAMKIVYQTVFAKRRGVEGDAAKIAEGRAGALFALDVLDATLAHQPYLVGEQFTLADLTYMPYLHYLDQGGQGDLVESRPNVAAWWDRTRARPTWGSVIG